MPTEHRSLYFDYPHFPFHRPAELDGNGKRHQVAIVGGGPVGMMAAIELGRRGIETVLLDDKDSVNTGSRALCLSRHTFETFDQAGVTAPFLEKSLGWTHGRSYYGTTPIFRLEMPHSEEERYLPMYNLQQQYAEQFLAGRAAELDTVDLRWQSRIAGVTQTGDHVTLSVETPEGPYDLEADYVLAADGARSAVRQALGLRLNGDAYEGRYVIADIQMKSDFPTERRAFFDPPCHPGSTLLIHRQPDDIWRIDYQIDEATDAEEALKEETIRTKIAAVLDMIGETGPWELEWWSLYKAYTLCLDDYRVGRVFFIGDSGHLVPIFGVRGLNNGISDAANIAWKLAYVLQGKAGPAILDSYSPERRGATLDVFENASKSTRFMTPPSRGYDVMRKAALSLALTTDFAKRFADPRQVTPYTYAASPLTTHKSRDSYFPSGPVAGAPVPDRLLPDGSFLLDHLGEDFTGLYFSDGPLPEEISALFAELAALSPGFKPLIVGDGFDLPATGTTLKDAYTAVDGTFYLIRPDRHIAARWRRAVPAEIVEALSQTLCLEGGRP